MTQTLQGSLATRPLPVRESENDNDSDTGNTQSPVLAVPATQSPSPDAPMINSETTTEPGRDLDLLMAERQPKRRKELEDVEVTAVLAQLVSERTYEVCCLRVSCGHCRQQLHCRELVNENMRGETENVNAGSFAAISVHNAANPDGWQPELLEKGTIVYGKLLRTKWLDDCGKNGVRSRLVG